MSAALLISEESLRDVFTLMDVDDSGKITLDELRTSLTELGVTPYIAERLSSALDSSKDGKIDFTEFTTAILSIQRDEETQRFNEYEAFLMFAQPDGKEHRKGERVTITAHELYEACVQCMAKPPALSDVHEIIRAMDRDQDGKVDYNDWLTMLQATERFAVSNTGDCDASLCAESSGPESPSRRKSRRLLPLVGGGISAAATSKFEKERLNRMKTQEERENDRKELRQRMKNQLVLHGIGVEPTETRLVESSRRTSTASAAEKASAPQMSTVSLFSKAAIMSLLIRTGTPMGPRFDAQFATLDKDGDGLLSSMEGRALLVMIGAV